MIVIVTIDAIIIKSRFNITEFVQVLFNVSPSSAEFLTEVQNLCKINNENSPSSPLILSQWLNKNIKLYQSEELPTEDFIVPDPLTLSLF